MAREALRVVAGRAPGMELPLLDEVVIGRSLGGDAALGGDPAISRRHARVARAAGGAIVVQDLGSSNGTYVNGQRVETSSLAIGDRLRVGDTTLELVAAPLSAVTSVHAVPAVREPDPVALRREFPVFERLLYLNAGTDGPVPARAAEAAIAQVRIEAARGRSGPTHWGSVYALWGELRARYAGWLGCAPDEVALTRATTDGVNTVLGALDLRRRDEIVTTDEEHQGVLAPLAAARERAGVSIRVVPFGEVASAVGPRTRLVACSHVSWMTGRVVDLAALRATGVPLLLDGAQALGAIPVDVRAIGCDFYAAPGQKWLCGADRTGCLYVRPEHLDSLWPPPWPNYDSLADTSRPLDLVVHRGARRFDPGTLPGVLARWSLGALDVLEETGASWVTARGPQLSARLRELLAARGLPVLEADGSTLVVVELPDAPGAVEWLEERRVLVRDVPGRDHVRVSVGAWCLDEDLERVVELAVEAAGRATRRVRPGG